MIWTTLWIDEDGIDSFIWPGCHKAVRGEHGCRSIEPPLHITATTYDAAYTMKLIAPASVEKFLTHGFEKWLLAIQELGNIAYIIPE